MFGGHRWDWRVWRSGGLFGTGTNLQLSDQPALENHLNPTGRRGAQHRPGPCPRGERGVVPGRRGALPAQAGLCTQRRRASLLSPGCRAVTGSSSTPRCSSPTWTVSWRRSTSSPTSMASRWSTPPRAATSGLCTRTSSPGRSETSETSCPIPRVGASGWRDSGPGRKGAPERGACSGLCLEPAPGPAQLQVLTLLPDCSTLCRIPGSRSRSRRPHAAGPVSASYSSAAGRTAPRPPSLSAKSRLSCSVASSHPQVVKDPPANEGDTGDAGWIPGQGRSLRGGNGNPLQDSCLGNPMDRGAWRATVCGVAELDMTEHACMHVASSRKPFLI